MSAYDQYTTEEMEKAFDLVADKDDWKMPIDTTISLKQIADAGVSVRQIDLAIIFFTGCVPDITRMTFDSGEYFRIRADGYYMTMVRLP